MAERTTTADVQRSVERLTVLCDSLDVFKKGTRIVLEKGSPTYGRAWRLMTVPPGQTGQYDGFNLGGWGGYLGWSAREAHQTILGLIAGIELAAYTTKEPR